MYILDSPSQAKNPQPTSPGRKKHEVERPRSNNDNKHGNQSQEIPKENKPNTFPAFIAANNARLNQSHLNALPKQKPIGKAELALQQSAELNQILVVDDTSDEYKNLRASTQYEHTFAHNSANQRSTEEKVVVGGCSTDDKGYMSAEKPIAVKEVYLAPESTAEKVKAEQESPCFSNARQHPPN